MPIDQCIAAVKKRKKEPPHQLRRLFMPEYITIYHLHKILDATMYYVSVVILA